MKNNKLAIAIPTYNRAAILKENILLMLEEIKKFSIPVYISDDSTNNETEIIVQEIKNDYEYIYYYKNSPSLGHDKNCLRTISLPFEDYVWYLGDSIVIDTNGIRKILDVIESNNNYDFVSVNVFNRDLDLPNKLFIDGNHLLVELGWHLTMTSATIYSNRIHDKLKELDLSKCKNFPQTALIFEKFAKVNCTLFWVNDKIIYGNKKKRSYWSSAVFEVFLKDWDSFISKLPIFYLEKNKRFTIKKHSEKSYLFTLKKFLNYRSKGFFSISILREYYKYIRFNSDVNIVLLIFISILPKTLLRFMILFFIQKR
jgi:hypothetical protein